MGLLALPVIAVQRHGVGFQWAAGYALALGVITYWMYAFDKRRAEQGGRRVPETSLHFLELLGGWAGAWIAQQWLRHKCSKAGYQVVFWLIVLLYQFVAIDSLRNWPFFRMALNGLAAR